MSSPSQREARRLPSSGIDMRGCSVFKWRLSPAASSEPVVCRLPPRMRVYLIHPDGRIQKHVPKVVTPGYEDCIAYHYEDAKGTLHHLGEYQYRVVQRYRPGNIPMDGHALIIDLRTLAGSWRSGELEYGFSLDTTRPFIGDVALASFLGAMLEVGCTDLVCKGFSNEEGESTGGSMSHVNGTNGDFRYLRNDGMVGPLHIGKKLARPHLLDEQRQNKLNHALHRFGWKTLLSYQYVLHGKEKLLDLTRHYEGHHHHLHLQGYAPDVEEVAQ